MLRLWTVGHSTRTLEELIGILAAHRIEWLADVRSVPRSRRHPCFDRATLPGPLGRAGIGYSHEPGLGGLRRPRADSTNLGWQNPGFRGYADHMETDEFERHFGALMARAAAARLTVMCAEAVPWRCHRSLIADAATARGIEVRHILTAGEARPHRMTPFARVSDGRVRYPGLAHGSTDGGIPPDRLDRSS